MITVFTSSYNHAEHLGEAIESVLGQTHADFEYLLVDDGSSDDTFKIIQRYARLDRRIRPVKLPKQANVGVVINHSVSLARGDHWTWCPADDRFEPQLLERKLATAAQHPGAVLYHDWRVMDGQGQIFTEVAVPPMTPEEFAEEVWRTSPIAFTGIWIPMELLRRLPFPEHLGFSEDFYWMIKATVHDVPFVGMAETLHVKRKHPNSLTDKNLPQILDQIPQIRAELLALKQRLKGGQRE